MKKPVFICIISLIAASIAPIHASLTIIESEEQFNKMVNANTPSVVVFSTEWCPACKHFKAPLENVANDPAFQNIAFIKVDTDKFNTLSNKYHIQSLPTTQFIQAGHQKKEITGARSEKELKDIILATFGQKTAMMLEEKKEEISKAVHDASLETKEKLKAAAEELEHAAQNMEEVIAETKREATTTEPVESAGPFQMVWNIVASIFIYAKDIVINFFSSIGSFFKNLFSSK
jgi:thioredoxin 1